MELEITNSLKSLSDNFGNILFREKYFIDIYEKYGDKLLKICAIIAEAIEKMEYKSYQLNIVSYYNSLYTVSNKLEFLVIGVQVPKIKVTKQVIYSIADAINIFIENYKENSNSKLLVEMWRACSQHAKTCELFFGVTNIYIYELSVALCNLMDKLNDENQELNKKIEDLNKKIEDLNKKIVHYQYAPGGSGYLEAKKDFETIKINILNS